MSTIPTPADLERNLLADLECEAYCLGIGARTGWPAAIRRAITAEADNQRLRAENAALHDEIATLRAGESVVKDLLVKTFAAALGGLADAAIIRQAKYDARHVLATVEQLAEHARSLRAQLVEEQAAAEVAFDQNTAHLRAALRPFADFWRRHPYQASPHWPMDARRSGDPVLPTLGDCQRAAEALGEGKSQGESQ